MSTARTMFMTDDALQRVGGWVPYPLALPVEVPAAASMDVLKFVPSGVGAIGGMRSSPPSLMPIMMSAIGSMFMAGAAIGWVCLPFPPS